MLKGHIEKTQGEVTYIWRAQPSACQICQDMNGTVFVNEEDIPDLLHPNCQCWVECIEEQSWEDGALEDDLDELLGDVSSFLDEVNKSINSIEKEASNHNDAYKSLLEAYLDDLRKIQWQAVTSKALLSNLDNINKETIKKIISKEQSDLNNNQIQYSNLLDYLEKEKVKYQKNLEKDNPFKDDITKHQELLELIRHTQESEKTKLPEGYKKIENYHDKKSAMDAAAYRKNDEIIFVFEGSKSFKDFWYDAWGLPRRRNPQLEPAQKFYDKIMSNPEYKNLKPIIAGYSLGGNIGTQLGAYNNIDTVVFEPYMPTDVYFQRKADMIKEKIEIHPEKVVVYKQEGDTLSTLGSEGHVGNVYTIPSNLGPFGHDLKKIPDLFQRTPEPIYQNPKTIYFPRRENIVQSFLKLINIL